jgi:hypothetical protein
VDLPRLLKRQRSRKAARRKQLRLFRETGDVGHGRKAAEHGRALRTLAGLIDAARRSLLPGPPGWAGSKQIIAEEVWPIVRKHGISPTSGKRSETFGNPGSDHFVGNITAFAKDFATVDNFPLAEKIRTALDGGNHVDYESFIIERRGHRYRVQIIAGTHGTGPHLHVGVRRES